MKKALNMPSVWLVDVFCFTPWYTAALAKALVEGEVSVRLICGELKQEPTYFRSLGLKPEPGPVRLAAMAGDVPQSIRRLLRVCDATINARLLARLFRSRRDELPDVLHLQQLPMLRHGLRSDFSLIAASQEAGVPVVHTVHNLLPHDSGEKFRAIYTELYRRVDHLICHSDCIAQRLIEDFGTSQKKISLIAHGPLFAPEHRPDARDSLVARGRLGLPADRPVVLWQGVIAEYKGIDILLKAWTVFIKAWDEKLGPAPLLLIAGKGSAELESQVCSAVLEAAGTIRADLGYIPTSKLRDYYTAADILVYPYRSITTSGALLTGLSYGKPIIASRLPPFAEYLRNGENALLVEPAHIGALAGALESLSSGAARSRQVSNLAGNGGYLRVVEGAQQNTKRFTGWTEIARRTLDLYRVLADEKAKSVGGIMQSVAHSTDLA